MNPLSCRLLSIMLVLLTTQACGVVGRGSQTFIASLEGQLVFQDMSAHETWYMLDFTGATVRKEASEALPLGVISPDGLWQLYFDRSEDTNDDGAIDYRDLADVYVSRVGRPGSTLVDLPFPVHTCVWGKEYPIVACSFAASDVAGGVSTALDNSVFYVVDLASGELLRRLSDPAKSSWSLAWSPDGYRVAFEIGTGSEGRLKQAGIQVVDARTGELVYELLEASADDLVWSPDSTRLAFVATLAPGEYSDAVVARMYRDVHYLDFGEGVVTLANVTRTSRFSDIPAALTHLGGIMVSSPVWSPNGQVIASVWRRDSSEQIWVTSVEGDDCARLTNRLERRYILVQWRP